VTAGRRSVIELLAAAAGVAVLHRILPLDGDDPFRLTLTILPLVVAALAALDRRARQLGARSFGGFAGGAELAALGVLVVVTVARHRLGLVAVDRFLAAGYLLVLAHHVGRLLVAWRPCLGRSLPRRPPAVFFFLPLVCYLALQPWMAGHRQPDGDEPFYLLITHSLAYDLDVDLANNYAGEDWRRFMERPIEPQLGDPVGAAGEVFSRHNPFLPLLLVPGYRLAGRWGAMATMAVLTALLAWMLLRLGHRYAPRRPGAVLLAYGLFAFAPPLLVYSYQIWVEVPAALLLAIALDRLLAPHRRPWGRREALLLALPLVALPLLKLRLALVALPLAFLAWRRARPGRRAAGWIVGVLAVGLGALFAHNAWRFGNPFKMYGPQEIEVLGSSPLDFARGGLGMFYDAAFGLFGCTPLWLLLVPAVWLAVRRRTSLAVDAAVVSLPYLLALAPRLEWYGGWSPPFRYPLVLLPLLALLLVPVLELRRRPGVRAAAAALGAATLILTLFWVVIPGWSYNFADGRGHLLDDAGARLGVDVARLFPSSVRPRPATWIWPAAALLLIPLTLGPGPSRRWSRAAGSWGVVALLGLTAGGTALAFHLPTRVVEVEDGFVAHRGGAPVPPRWVPHRPSFRTGWALPAGGRVVAPVIPGGERVGIRLSARRGVGDVSSLEVAAGDARIATVELDGDGWREVAIGPVDWPEGAPLVISIPGEPEPGNGRGRVIVDRAVFDWR